MKVNELVTKGIGPYDFSQHLKKTYISYAEKIAIADRAIQAASFVNANNTPLYRQNTPMMNLFFHVGVIEKYTDIEFANNPINDYDLLSQNGLLNTLLHVIPKQELGTCKDILDMRKADFAENVHSVASLMETKIESLNQFFKQMSEVFTPDMIAKLGINK